MSIRAMLMICLGATAAVAVSSMAWAQAAADPQAIPESRYVVVRDGRLTVDGQRQRFWGVIGQPYTGADIKPGDTPEQRAAKVAAARAGTEALLDRFEALGFNAIRLWDGFYQPREYTVDDGSSADSADYFIKRAGERGFRIWTAGMNRLGEITADDATVIDDPTTEAAWREAIASLPNGRADLRSSLARSWDPRIEKLATERMAAVATHFNRHTGLRWADDPTFGVWELSNEEWWMRKMVNGSWQRLPAFFRNSLVAKWNDHLRRKYKDDAALADAWAGLLPGESLAAGTVLLAPMAGKSRVSTALNDSNPAAISAMQGLEQEYTRDSFSRQRGADVIEFFMDLHLARKQREAQAIKALGRSTKLSPMVYDTGIGYEIQSLYLHQNAAAVAMAAYVNGWGPALEEWLPNVDKQPNEQQRARVLQEAERISANVADPIEGGMGWVNWLLKPPGISQGVPWLEHNRIEGKPFLVYETQIAQPAKYRADYPIRLAALAAIQDWDWINWHYFGDAGMHGRLRSTMGSHTAFDQPLDITTGSHPQGYHYTYDPTQSATMRAAAYLFRTGALKPAASPTVFTYGRDSLYDPLSMDYGGSYGMVGLDMLQTAYQYGMRIRVDPTQQGDRVEGPVVTFAQRNQHNPYTPTEQITFDWRKGFVELDAPGGVAWTGLLARYGDKVEFDNASITMSDVVIRNDPGMHDPVGEDERYITFSLFSRDGLPLDKTRRAGLSLVSTSFNTGFELRQGAKTLSVAGTKPVLFTRVGATISGEALSGMKYSFKDWTLREIATGTIDDDGRLVIPADLPVFTVDLERP